MKLGDDRIAAIKAATHALLARFGCLEAASTVCRVSVPVLSEYQSFSKPDRIMPLDVAYQLEVVIGEPVLTGAVARMQGWTLTRPAQGQAPEIGRAVALVSRQAGAAVAAFLEAHADGVVDAGEAAELRRLLETVRDGADATLTGLTAPVLKVVA
jgi:hypothetical protein